MSRIDLTTQRQPAIAAAVQPASTVALANPIARRLQRSLAMIIVVLPFLGFLIALALSWGHSVGYAQLTLLAAMYFATLLAIEVGFHRHFAHRAFQSNTFVRIALGILGSMAAQGPLIFWVAIHRRHHAYSDRPGDPHSPNLHERSIFGTLSGLWHAHVGWLFDFETADWVRYAPDLLRESGIFRLHRLYPLWVLLGLLIPSIAGGLLAWTWPGVFYGFLWGGLVRMFLVDHSIWSVNSLCHLFGNRTFQSGDHSTNNFWLAFTSLGGSWHNNHHAFPNSAKNGMAWWQIDPAGSFIGMLKMAGLVWDVKAPTPDMLANARINSPKI
jgi:stearoyl-CoA desaturase (delta-9 desaturase)